MRLSALEIKKKEFQQKMRGFDPEEVQAFLDKASEEVELLSREKKESDDKVADIQQRLDHFLSLEQTLEKTLVAAQSTAIKMEDQAKREAELILRDAQLERDRKLNDVRIDLQRAQSELIRVRSEYDMTLARMRSLLAGFSTFLGGLEQEHLDSKLIQQASTVETSTSVSAGMGSFVPSTPSVESSTAFQDFDH